MSVTPRISGIFKPDFHGSFTLRLGIHGIT